MLNWGTLVSTENHSFITVPDWPLYKQRSLPNISKPNVQCLHETALFCHREIFITSVITRIQTIIKYKSLLSNTIYHLCEPCPAFWRPKQNPLYYDCKCAERFTITPPAQRLRLGRGEQKPESSRHLDMIAAFLVNPSPIIHFGLLQTRST